MFSNFFENKKTYKWIYVSLHASSCSLKLLIIFFIGFYLWSPSDNGPAGQR